MKQTIYGKHPTLPLFVSIDGKVRRSEDAHNKRVRKWHAYSTHMTHNFYERITMRTHGKVSQPRIHRLVVETFIGEIPEGLQVDHINNIPHDNRLENLQILSPSANTYKDMIYGEAIHCSKYTNEQILALKVDLEKCPKYFNHQGQKLPFIQELVNKHNIDRATIVDIWKGKSWSRLGH